jgi:cyclophilin family peptidyl-prolyl cis-trans isomerase
MRLTSVLALSLVLPLIVPCVVAAQSSGSHGESGDAVTTDAKGTPEQKPEVKVEVKADADAKGKTGAASGSNPVVVLETNYGAIRIELFKDKAPVSAENFLSYVKSGFYDGTIFHRVVKGFVIQAGGWKDDLTPKPPKAPIKNEATNGLSNLRGTLSVARTGEINSGTTHFFINLVDNKRLDHTGEAPAQYGYAVFGKVVSGMDVVDKIALVEVTSKGGNQNVPVKPVVITKATIAGAGQTQAATKVETKEKPKAEAKQIGDPEANTQGK